MPRPRVPLLVCASVLLAIHVPSARAQQAAPIAVVVNARNPVSSLSMDELRRLYSGKSTTFPTKQRAVLLECRAASEPFYHRLLGLSPDVVRQRWIGIVFRGEAGSVPLDMPTPDAVRRYVSEHEDAIGFIPAAAVDATVKVLAIDGARPGDPGYRL
ncbi:MAG TPA: hypothetical protein VFK13_05945 [Gemmatimonadaceae bacterium]|nr:hypothetical protein [Gemmatimonadaceae bacterium]